ncbi:hypothetical protein [secondary endosymbiont of Ctenarytaina eucalypti]|uniref:Uncharacterized protein n=1 Tax=secondary endosymbiont of Ctenarytaina eucalypti TaxID=1199245 RepID=J3YR74_9ENTR|nr:hypothetical protein [secondary endosymbiont of Ctenarytaina eucalypti]AFP84513.1 hypothetical protein A359_01090 [secondary endosymbiont of Ctenarytaina eucalypti]
MLGGKKKPWASGDNVKHTTLALALAAQLVVRVIMYHSADLAEKQLPEVFLHNS